ncbi:transcription factor MYB48-like [Rutidosis leptorrhynchoides]|uniref:transcription factor MYB48-like n=1 Tax=Rutidosis leptorrhynchoides TaxID=125765 RepID=UPI003A993FF2
MQMVKNYWRTRMRKKPQENKKCSSPSTSFSNTSSSSTCTNDPSVDSMPMDETKERSFYDTGGIEMVLCGISRSNNNRNTMMKHDKFNNEELEGIYSMDEIWKEIDMLENEGLKPVFDSYSNGVTTQIWDYSFSTSSFWMKDD